MQDEVKDSAVVIGSRKDIKTDVEYVKNQLLYLEQYQQKLIAKSKQLNAFKIKWHGPAESESIYKEVDRWVKCFNQLGEHLAGKEIPDDAIKQLQSGWGVLVFNKPSTVEEDQIKGIKKIAYAALPFYRIALNKKKVKSIMGQIKAFSDRASVLKNLAYKVEAFYMDGL